MKKIILNNRNEGAISFVLSDDEGRIIAVIVPKPDVDCIDVVAQAIMEEFCDTTKVRFEKVEFDDAEFITQVELEVVMFEENNDEEFIREFKLTKTAIYQ